MWFSAVPIEDLGLIPTFLSEDDPRPAREQLHEAYAHGGGWRPFTGFTLNNEGTLVQWTIKYPGDPALRCIAITSLGEGREIIMVFQHAWVLILSPDSSWEVARMD